jgi:YggT family protein
MFFGFVRPLSTLWYWATSAYVLAIFVYTIMSWVPDKGSFFAFYRWLGTICEPYIGLFRRVLPTAWMASTGMDFSPLVAWAVLSFIVRPLGSAILALVGL